MKQRDVEELLGQLDSKYQMSFDLDEFNKRMWTRFLLEQNVIHASEAVRRICERQRERPTVADIRNMITAIAGDNLAAAPAVEEPNFVRELPSWVKGWLVSRSRRDLRVWPDQKPGYDSLQREHSETRTYVWPEQILMPDNERSGYEEEGSHLTASQLGTLLAGATGI